MQGSNADGSLPGNMTATVMNLPNDSTNLPGIQVRMEQRDGAPELKDLMRQMITALQREPVASAHADMGGKDTRPSDLATQFSPRMDQELHLYTGEGDDMVRIV
jgi:hypothetical protein